MTCEVDTVTPFSQKEELHRHKRVLIIGFGGTIAMVRDEQGVLKPAKGIKEIVAQVPSLKEMADVDCRQLESRDSTNIHATQWRELARHLHDWQATRYDGFIVTHGTDTMAYTAGAVALSLGRSLQKPIVFTGAQLPFVDSGTDARFNLENSMKTVVEASNQSIVEVMITFSDKVFRAARTIKTSEARFQAFDSPAFPPLAMITATGVEFHSSALRREQVMIHDLGYFTDRNRFERGVLTVDLVPGLEPDTLSHILRYGRVRGLLLKSLGAGNVPSEGKFSLIPVIQMAVERLNIPVLVVTKYAGGNTRMGMYEPGMKALEAGAISTGDMTDVLAQVKLMWLLGQMERKSRHISMDELRDKVQTNYIGEIST